MRNDFFVDDSVVEISIGDEIALIDLSDFDKIKDQTWHKHYGRDRDNFCVRNARKPYVRMHRLITGVPPNGLFVDHINGNSLDNRRSNLRFASRAMNKVNSSKSKGYYPYQGKWVAKIRVDKKLLHLGTFDTEDAARQSRLAAEKQYFGEFAPRREA